VALPLADFFSGALSAFCTPRCNPAFARYFFECGFEASGELFIQYCSTNANNERCYNLLNTLATDAVTVQVQSSCPMDGSSSSSSCQSSILTYRNNSVCCVSVFNMSSIFNTAATNSIIVCGYLVQWKPQGSARVLWAVLAVLQPAVLLLVQPAVQLQAQQTLNIYWANCLLGYSLGWWWYSLSEELTVYKYCYTVCILLQTVT